MGNAPTSADSHPAVPQVAASDALERLRLFVARTLEPVLKVSTRAEVRAHLAELVEANVHQRLLAHLIEVQDGSTLPPLPSEGDLVHAFQSSPGLAETNPKDIERALELHFASIHVQTVLSAAEGVTITDTQREFAEISIESYLNDESVPVLFRDAQFREIESGLALLALAVADHEVEALCVDELLATCIEGRKKLLGLLLAAARRLDTADLAVDEYALGVELPDLEAAEELHFLQQLGFSSSATS